MPRYATLTRPRTLLAGYVLVRVGAVGLLAVLLGVDAMLDLLWQPELVVAGVAVPTLAGLVGVSFRLDVPW